MVTSQIGEFSTRFNMHNFDNMHKIEKSYV